ncbi:MAG: hypothetical protein HFE51_10215 [Clostridia bacterium]|nr:hypothetical protein [Clostridia bacterium]MCI9086774.1 hypothetical protein [Clostridia bacterium]NDO20256.1 hypothetical protein [Lachnospiraceae bacterium MD329]
MNIRKTLTVVAMTAVFLCSISVSADVCKEYATDDYRDQPVWNQYGEVGAKPIAKFRIIRSRNGEVKDILESYSDNDLYSDFPAMQCYVGDTITFEDLSSPTDGSGIKTWDFQYYGTLGDSYQEYNYNILESARFELTEPGETAFFLCVKSNLPVKVGSLDPWSDNGNHQAIGKNKWFPNGMYWYFATARVIVNAAPEAKVNLKYWDVPNNKVFYEEQRNLGEMLGDNIIKTNIHITDWEGYEYSGWNVQTEDGDIQYTGDVRDVDIELAPWVPVKNLNVEYYPYVDTELRVRYWDSEAGRIMSEETVQGEQVVRDKKTTISYTPQDVEGYDYGGWSVQLPDSSIEGTGEEKPVVVGLDGTYPIKYLNIKCYPKDGTKPPPSTGGSTGGSDDIIKPSGECDGEIEWTETDSHRVRNGSYSDGTPRYRTCYHIFTYRATLSADATVTPSTFKSGYGFETKVNYSVKTKLVDNDGDYCSSWGNSRSAIKKVKDPTKATVYIPWSMTNRLGTQSKSIAMEKSGKSFQLPKSPVSETGARKIYTDVSLAGTKEEPVNHSFEIYISGGGVGSIEFCKKLSKTITINGDMFEDDFSGAD